MIVRMSIGESILFNKAKKLFNLGDHEKDRLLADIINNNLNEWRNLFEGSELEDMFEELVELQERGKE